MKKILFLLLLVVVFACNTKQKQSDNTLPSHSQEEKEAKGIQISADSLKPPVIIPAGTPQTNKTALKKTTTRLLDSLYPQGLPHFTTFTTDQGLALDAIACSVMDKSGNLWFGTDGGGVSRYDPSASLRAGFPSFTNFTTTQGLANNVVLSITQDKSGNLWFGTDGGGVSRYDGTSFTNFTTTQGLANNVVLSITEDKSGNLWFGTYGGGVSRYDGTSFTNFTTAQGLANNVVRSITQDKSGNLWFGTDGGGVSRLALSGVEGYDGTSFTNFTTAQGLANNVVFSITQDKSGNLWFGTYGGVAFLPESSEFVTATKLHPKASKSNSISQQVTHNQLFITIGTSNGLPDDAITQVLQGADGKIYVGTNYGIASFDVPTKAEINAYYANLNTPTKPKLTLKNLEVYNSSTSYPVKDVNAGQNCMYQDSKGIIWAGTGSDKTALVRFNPKTVNKTKNPPTTSIQSIKIVGENICWYNMKKTEVGSPKSEVGSSASSEGFSPSADGRYRGVISSEDSLIATQDSMAMLLAQFNAFGKPVSQDILDNQKTKFSDLQFDGITNWYPLPQNLVLPYKYNSISFDYLANELSRNHLVRYQYQLEGQDENWSPITDKNDASYTNLYEGNYTFKIKAQYTGPGNNEWSEVTTFTFKVLPPWYRTWWMYTVYFVLLTAGIWLLVWWNGRKLRARAEELKVEVKKATKEIVEQKKVVEEKHKEITDSINYAERIQRSFLATTEMLDKYLGVTLSADEGSTSMDVTSSADEGSVSRSERKYFVFFRPKDVVSGDFYWAAELNNGNFAFSVADSTGHGVPGAIMSVLNISSLEKSIETQTEPHHILSETRRIIIDRLKKDGSPDGGKDGMDCSLLVINKDRTQLSFAAANNPVFIVRSTVIASGAKQSHSNEQILLHSLRSFAMTGMRKWSFAMTKKAHQWMSLRVARRMRAYREATQCNSSNLNPIKCP